jgi:tetratricopeptide (TPR) repeat protein
MRPSIANRPGYDAYQAISRWVETFAVMNSSSLAPRNKPGGCLRVLRPLLWWAVLVLGLYGLRTHERLMQETRLRFEVRTAGEWSADGAQVTFDGIPVSSGEQVSLGSHRFEVKHPKAVIFSTNLFIWYGGRDLGLIKLERARGNLTLAVETPAREVVVVGPDWRVELTNSRGLTSSVPTDAYSVEARWNHYQQSARVVVNETTGGSFRFAPPLGAIHLASSHAATTFNLLNASGQTVVGGNFPDTVSELPAGAYQLQAERRGEQRISSVAVKGAATNEIMLKFEYGAVVLDSDPPGASVISGRGENLGKTPLTLSEVPAGVWKADLRLEGYLSVPLSISITVGETNRYWTNLVNLDYSQAMMAAKNYQAAGDLERAQQAVTEALKIQPNDLAGMTLRRELTVAELVGQAKASIGREDYGSARNAVAAALKLVPENPELVALAKDIDSREEAKKKQEEVRRTQGRQECLAIAKKAFDDALTHLCYSGEGNLFERNELQTTGTVGEVESRIIKALETGSPSFQVRRKPHPCPDAFLITGQQELPESARRSYIIAGSQTNEHEVQIIFEVLEYKTKREVSLAGGLSFNTSYVPLHPSRVGEFTEKMKVQIAEGRRIVRERLTGGVQGKP